MKATFLALALVAGATLAITSDDRPRCFEDEVIVWTGETHGRCVPVDDYLCEWDRENGRECQPAW